MPQVDLSSVCAGVVVTHDPKVSCETFAVAGDDSTEESPATVVMDYAPESFWLSKDAEYDWFDRNAFMDRKDSGRGIGNTGSNSFSSSTRYFSIKPKALIIGLPKSQKQNFAETQHWRPCRTSNIRLFPKRSGPVSKPGLGLIEPGSPKVSCIGRVRSRKDRSRRGKSRKKVTEPGLVKVKSIKVRKTGFWSSLRSIFGSKKGKQGCKGSGTGIEPVTAVITKSGSSKKKKGKRSEPVAVNPVQPPTLGGIKRFESSRRSDAWAENLEVISGQSEPLDRGSIWRRRSKGCPGNVHVGRDWQSVGPASV